MTFKILLINPPRGHLVRLDTPDHVDLGEFSAFPPIGFMYIAQALRQRNPDFVVKILDPIVEKMHLSKILELIDEFKPNVIGLAAFSFTFYDSWKTATEIKKRFQDIPIVVGGPNMYFFAEETMHHKCFDYGLRGDGEIVFAELCETMAGKKKMSKIPEGLFVRQNNKVIGSGTAILTDLDYIKIPAIDLLDCSKYYSPIGLRKATGTIITSRGCPYNCTFCQVPHVKYRMRNIDNVIMEIKEYLKKSINDFFIFDDLFNITTQRVKDFALAILKDNLKITWMFRGRLDQIDAEMLQLAKKAGCHTISVGIEDATDEGLELIKKKITIQQAKDAVSLIRKNGIRCSANWIMGFPHHKTIADLDNMIKTAIEVDSDYAQFGVLQCMPGSELYDQAVAEGGIDPNEWKNYILNPVQQFSPLIWEKYLKKEQLFAYYKKGFNRFYLRPRCIIRELFRIRSFDEAKNKIKTFLTIFG